MSRFVFEGFQEGALFLHALRSKFEMHGGCVGLREGKMECSNRAISALGSDSRIENRHLLR